MYVLRRGRVRIPLTHAIEPRQNSVELGPGAVFGELAALSNGRRTADVVAIDAVQSISFDRVAVEPMLWRHPELALVLTELVAHRLARTNEIQQVGEYRLGGPLGRGGTSRVYEGEHVGQGRKVAIKMLDHRLAYDRAFRDRFLLEARTVASLDHPNIVKVVDTAKAFATYFIVMERVVGVTLSGLLRRKGALSEARASPLLAQIAAALDHAHSRGVLHRDVKPSNCIVDARGRVQLMDFGIATRIGDSTADPLDGGRPTIIGTPRYMAPEVILGEQPTVAADWYGLGVVAFELLAGEPPFMARDVRDLLHQHKLEAPPLERLDGLASDALRTLIARCLAKSPADRPATAAEFRTVLGLGTDSALPGYSALSDEWTGAVGVATTGVAPTVDLEEDAKS
jgi:serine/threonine protein kinase